MRACKNNRRRPFAFAALVALAFAFVTPAFATQDAWVHVRVNGGDDEQVTVNLPLSLMRTAAAMIPEDVQRDAEISIDEMNMDWQELMEFWRSVKDAPEATFVTVQTRDETLAVKKEGDFMLVKTEEAGRDGTHVDVKLPLMVIDALLSGPEGTLDFQAALDALADYGPGHLVSIRDGDETVEVWIDYQNEAH